MQLLVVGVSIALWGGHAGTNYRDGSRGYWLGDKALYLAAVKASKPAYSLTGLIPAAGMKSASDMLVAFDEELKAAKYDLARTFDDRFVRRAAGRRRGLLHE